MVTVLDLPRSISVRAAAKINLHLGVGAVRDDGFPPLDTVNQALSLYDAVPLAPAGMPSLARSSSRLSLKSSRMMSAECGESSSDFDLSSWPYSSSASQA